MNKIIHLPIIILCTIAIALFSCSSDTVTPDITVKMKLTVEAGTTFKDTPTPTFTYNDKDGKEQSFTITKSWETTFVVKSGYKLYAKSLGKVTAGKVTLIITAVGNGNNVISDQSAMAGGTEDEGELNATVLSILN